MLILNKLYFNCIHALSVHNILQVYAFMYILLTVTLWG